MTIHAAIPSLSVDSVVADFFQRSAGQWRSERRYYTVSNDETQEVVSFLTVRAIAQNSPELVQLAQLHGLDDAAELTCGAVSSWESSYMGPSPKKSKGSTVFGVKGASLYRDRGFSTTKPIIAQFTMRDDNTLCLRTEYSGNVFEEEIKLIGTQYRTRQTIISRAGQEQMIGQYIEKRIHSV
ncbi:MAG: phycobiliprotein lyase [Leptolyngbyaceae bacterium]|nr:phycobiliprotein lyase [Leptolyngbyaceae bacterium]